MEQLDVLRFTLATLEDLNIPYMVVGSFASGVYGEPRFTHDIDIHRAHAGAARTALR